MCMHVLLYNTRSQAKILHRFLASDSEQSQNWSHLLTESSIEPGDTPSLSMAAPRAAWIMARTLSHRLLESNRVPAVTQIRSISSTPVCFVKKIEEKVVGDVTVIEGTYVDHTSDKLVLKSGTKTGCCPLCDLNLPLHYSDVLIISQFLRPGRGTVLPRRITGLCAAQQKQIDMLAYQAGKAGLLKKVFMKSLGTKDIMTKKPGHKLPRYY